MAICHVVFAKKDEGVKEPKPGEPSSSCGPVLVTKVDKPKMI
jgi:hypothetical protein